MRRTMLAVALLVMVVAGCSVPDSAGTTTTTRVRRGLGGDQSYTDGTFIVGSGGEIHPGSYRTEGDAPGDGLCYYARYSAGTVHNPQGVIRSDWSNSPMRIQLGRRDRFVTFDGGCVWRKVS